MNIRKKLKKWNKRLAKKLKGIRVCFRADHYLKDLGEDDRFASRVSVLFRKLLRYPVYVVLGVWIASVIYGIAHHTPFPDLLVNSLLWTAGNLLALVLLLFLLMLLAAVAKVMTGLMLDGQLPDGAENPIDGFIAYLVQGRL